MIVPDRSFVKRLRRLTRAEVKASPALRRERRRVRRRWTQDISLRSLRWMIPLIVLGAVLGTERPEKVAPFLVVWTLAVTFTRAGEIVTALSAGPILWLYYVLPVTSSAVFRHHFSVLARSSVWIAVDWLAFGLAAASCIGTPAAWIAAPVFAGAQAVTALAVAWLLATRMPGFPFGLIGSLLAGGVIFLAQVGNTAGGAAFVAKLLRTIWIGTPGGWLASAQTQASRDAWGWIAAVLLTAAAVAFLRRTFTRIGTEFSLERAMGFEDKLAAQQTVESAEPEIASGSSKPAAPKAGAAPQDVDAVRARIEETLTTAPGMTLFRRGWLEANVARLLSPRQRVMADFLQPRGLSWGVQWLIGFSLIGGAVAARATGFNEEWLAWLPSIGLLVGTVSLLGGWAGLETVHVSNGVMGVHAFLPLGFFEMAWTILKAGMVRCTAAVPLIVLAVRSGFTPTPLPWGETLPITLRVTVIMLAVLPVGTLVSFSKVTNDTSSGIGFRLLLLSFLVLCLIGGVSLGVALFVAETPPALFAIAALMLLITYGILAIYGYFWGRGTFDLIAKPPSR